MYTINVQRIVFLEIPLSVKDIGILTEVGMQLYHNVVLIAYHEYARLRNTWKDYRGKCLI